MEDQATFELLDAFAAAFNRHDTAALMAMMTEDAVFQASAGPDIEGAVSRGRANVAAGFETVFATFPDAQWSHPKHFIAAIAP